jgi:exosortase A-associated hydrolase 2
VFYIPPFAEEMNKARRTATLMAERVHRHNANFFSLDLFGTGDSEGEFHDARWDIWLDNLHTGLDYLRSRQQEQITLLGLRLGAMLAAEFCQKYTFHPHQLVLWQPPGSGQQLLTQFLRIQLAADMQGGDGKGMTTQELRAQLANGTSLEIAGYALHPELFHAIERIRLADILAHLRQPIALFEITGTSDKPLTLGTRRLLESLPRSTTVHAQPVKGEPFWSIQEITVSEALLDATEAFLYADQSPCRHTAAPVPDGAARQTGVAHE